MTLQIGPLRVDPPVVLAPMAGVTNAAFRALCRSYGAGLYVSEMVSARALVERNLSTALLVTFSGDEPIRSVQLYAVAPQVAAEAVRRVIGEFGADHVDLNFGCPSPKVTRRGGGAALPAHGRLFSEIVASAVRAAGPVPVTVKMRTGVDGDTLTYLDCGRRAAAAGAAAIALHARTAEQLYSGRADWTAVARLVEAVPAVPVLGNGDIWAASDALELMARAGCQGVVVGRGCLGRPWLFGELAAAFAGDAVPPPRVLGQVMAVMRLHAAMLAELKGDEYLGVRDFRKHVGWYLTGYPVGSSARRLLASASTLAELEDLLGTLDPTTALPPGAERLARGHTQGPRPVSLPDGWLARAADPVPPEGADLAVSGG